MHAVDPFGAADARRTFLAAWVVAGTADIVVAVTYYPLTAPITGVEILQGIASGLLGARAFTGGVQTAIIGLACHYGIALIWTAFFFLIYPRVAFLRRHILITATVYGTFVSLSMRFIVLPLSKVASRPFNFHAFAIATIILWFTIGLPLSLFARRLRVAAA